MLSTILIGDDTPWQLLQPPSRQGCDEKQQEGAASVTLFQAELLVGSCYCFMEETMRTLTCLAVTAVVLVNPFAVSRARTEVYRCVLDGGHISYQQIPCTSQSKPMELKDQTTGWSPLRPGERSLLNSYRDEDAARRRKPSGLPEEPAKESKACWEKRKQLEAVRSQLRRGYSLREADELHRKLDDYDDYLREFCS